MSPFFLLIPILIVFLWWACVFLISLRFFGYQKNLLKKKILVWALVFVLSLLFPISMIAVHTIGPNPFISGFFTLSSILLGASLIWFLVILGLIIFEKIFFRNQKFPYKILISSILFLCIFTYSLFAGFSLQKIETTIQFPNQVWSGKKIVLVTDTHYGAIFGEKSAQKLVDAINLEKPDIVLVAGDFFDGPKVDFSAIAKIFSRVESRFGIYFANGNHEEYRHTAEMLDALSKNGIHILNNEKTLIEGIQIAGVTYRASEHDQGLEEILSQIKLSKDHPTILLKHKPTQPLIIGKYPIDLVVSGHTHRGQMWPFSLIAEWVYGDLVYGKNQVSEKLTWITSSGVGSWGPPTRLGSRSEIWVISVK